MAFFGNNEFSLAHDLKMSTTQSDLASCFLWLMFELNSLLQNLSLLVMLKVPCSF